MRKYLELPSIEYLNEIFDVDFRGVIFWKKRPISHFRNVGIANSWNGKHAYKKAGRPNKHGYLQVGINGVRYMSHRIVYQMKNGPVPVDMEVDHENGIHDDNKPSNLRLATKFQNQHNSSIRSDNTTKIKGVHRHASGGWEGSIQKNNISYTKFFLTQEQAAKWLEEKRKALHESFSNNGYGHEKN